MWNVRKLGPSAHWAQDCWRSDYSTGSVWREIVGADGRRRGLGRRVEECGTVVESELSTQKSASWFFRGGLGRSSRRCKRSAGVKGQRAQQAGGVSRGSVIEGGGLADGLKQVVGNETDVKPAVAGLGDEAVAAFGKDQGVDAGGDQIVEQVADVLGCGGCRDGRAQGTVIVGDGGGEPMGTLPQATDIHGRNSSSAV